MSIRPMHCPACDGQVRVTDTPTPLHGGQPTLPDSPQLVCLDFGEQCAGRDVCPLAGLPRMVMAVRLARSGLRPHEEWQTVRMPCSGCGQTLELEVLDDDYAYCPACGTTNRRVIIQVEDETYMTLAGTE
jgi:predicted RNA-binding Zn-ribbon protein involved in translation (DUF1610 family)